MFHEIDLRPLAARQGPERAFLSLYLSGPDAFSSLGRRIRTVRGMLATEPAELEYFEENLKMVEEFLEDYRFETPSVCLFACWALDYLEAFPLERQGPDLLWVDSSPYIRPIAELQDEFENYVVIAADNSEAHLYFVTSAVADEEIRVRGDVKNSVKVGGWSQKRYQRRREKELHGYAAEVAEALSDLDGRESFDRIVLVGSREAMAAIRAALPQQLAERVTGEQTVDLGSDDAVWREAYGIYWEGERASEEALWERIKDAYLRQGPAAAGPEEVLRAAGVGRVRHLIAVRDARLAGIRCRDCGNLSAETSSTCPICASESVFPVDLVNELVELMAQTSAEVEFTDPIPGLSDVGGVAALLRY